MCMTKSHWVLSSLTGLMVAGLLTASPCLAESFAEKGGGSTGGGNSTTDRYRDVEQFFGRNSETVKNYLKDFSDQISKYQSEGESSALLQDVVAQGLMEDIDQSKYIFSKKCTEDGDEKDASTLRGVRNAPICINIPKLVRDNASKAEIIGLMMHEHVRHFGIEDTTDADIHPTAVFVTDRIDYLHVSGSSFTPSTKFLLKDAKVTIADFDFLFAKRIILESVNPKDAHLIIEEIQGHCPTGPLYDNDNVTFEFKVGTKIPFNQTLKAEGGFWGISDTCQIKFSIENSYGKAEVPGTFQLSHHIPLDALKVDLSDNRPAN